MLLSEIALYLEMQGVAVRGQNVWAGEIPVNAPSDIAIALYETGGGPPLFVHNQNQRRVESAGVQAIVRATDYEVGRAKAEEIVRALTFRDRILSGVRYLSMVPVQSPIDIGRDGNERHRLSVNFDVMKEPS